MANEIDVAALNRLEQAGGIMSDFHPQSTSMTSNGFAALLEQATLEAAELIRLRMSLNEQIRAYHARLIQAGIEI